MAFDACMLSCVINEINKIASGGKTEKIYQPERDEIILQIRTSFGEKKLLINAGSNNPRIGFTAVQRENPLQAPMFCMLLRKHLTGALLSSVEQLGFERAAKFTFEARDEMGFACKRYIIAEIMGKYSNLIFTDDKMKIISVLKSVDFTTSRLRQVLPGMSYELPPAQNKLCPTTTNRDEFYKAYLAFPSDKCADKFITSTYFGISSVVAREISFRACGSSDALLENCSPESLMAELSKVIAALNVDAYEPTVIFDGGSPIEYSFTDLSFYGTSMEHRRFETVSEALDVFFEKKDREQRIKQRASDVLKIITNAELRISKKLENQRMELECCKDGERYKRYGDLITANLYRLKRGERRVELVDYEKWDESSNSYNNTVIELDERLSPAANAQRYYKLYAKSKTAKHQLTRQIEIGNSELEYIYSIFEALAKAENSADLAEIRDELYKSGYASKMKGYAVSRKPKKPVVAEFRTTNGYKVLCGKNNYQNEYITHTLAERCDYWFHAKGVAGSHVLLVTNGSEPPERDFTDACEIAAFYSKARNGSLVSVDYLLAKEIKRVPGAKPGFVTYKTNWSAYVTPSEEHVMSMRKKN